MNCPCHSKKPYEECCKPYHEGTASAATPLLLMRSRYSAYALHLTDYIKKTTHKDCESYSTDPTYFCLTTDFVDLVILNEETTGNRGTVTFKATLYSNGKDCSFTEKSTFIKQNGKWLYRSGVHIT